MVQIIKSKAREIQMTWEKQIGLKCGLAQSNSVDCLKCRDLRMLTDLELSAVGVYIRFRPSNEEKGIGWREISLFQFFRVGEGEFFPKLFQISLSARLEYLEKFQFN